MKKKRCSWAIPDDMIEYHDREWGVPQHDDHRLYEALVLGGAQAGLSWATIYRRREGYRRAFDQFDPQKVARYSKRSIARLLADEGIIRNRLKVESAVANAKAVLAIQDEFGSLDGFLWNYVDGRPIKNRFRELSDLPAETPLSQQLSKDLKGRGFRFVGPTICYAFMQAVGMVNDHVVSCFRYKELSS